MTYFVVPSSQGKNESHDDEGKAGGVNYDDSDTDPVIFGQDFSV